MFWKVGTRNPNGFVNAVSNQSTSAHIGVGTVYFGRACVHQGQQHSNNMRTASAPASSGAHSPTQVAKVAPYLAINPGLFDSVDHWSYRDLQKLAKRLELPSTGKREEVVERLRAWHREQRTTGQAGQFHAVQVRATPEGKAISPRLLSPLISSARGNGTPGVLKGGILSSSKKNAYAKRASFSGSESDRSVAQSPAPLGSRGGVLFSPYNMVKLIPSKEHSEMFGQYREPCHFADDDESDEE